MRITLIVLLFQLIPLKHFGQFMIDSAITIPMVGISYAYQFPGNSMKERFGNNSNVGGQFAVKLKSNAYIGIKAHYIWGTTVNEEDVLRNIRTSEGGIIEHGGILSDPSIEQSGYDVFLMGGYVFPIFGPNPNSGILVCAGPGFLQHQIEIDFRNAQIPQLSEEYRRGYDHLSNGFALNQFIGYIHYGNKKLINFYVGMDFTQAWTKNRRGYSYDKMSRDDGTRYDSLYGIRVGWILALYRRAPDKFYYH